MSKVIIRPTKASTFARHRPLFRKPPPAPSSSSKAAPSTAPPGAAAASAQRVGVNREFFRQLGAILRIIIPHATSKEVWLLGAHTAFLLLRTYLSLLVAQLDGKLVGDLVSANGRGFLEGLAYWFLLAIPSVYTNAMIRLLQSKLAISFRTRLTRYVHDLYLDHTNTFYKVVNLDARIGSSGADQFVTTDVSRFCDTLSALYSNVSKPSLDLILFNVQLGRSIGPRGSALLLASYAATVWILRKVTPAFGKLAAIEAKLEGDFRAAHSRLIINAEEIACVPFLSLSRARPCTTNSCRRCTAPEQVLRRRADREGHPHEGLPAPHQAHQLDLQGALPRSSARPSGAQLTDEPVRPQIRILYGMVRPPLLAAPRSSPSLDR